MKSKKLLSLIISLVMSLGVIFTGCGSSSQTSSTGASKDGMDKDQTINLSMLDLTTLSSLRATDAYSLTVLTETMEGLTRNENDGKTDTIKPAGAEKWDISKDGRVWTFHLRDHKWSDGKPVTAKDYVYAWEKLLNPKTAADYASLLYCVKGGEEYNNGKGSVDNIGLKAVDDKTFEVTLNEPVPYFQQVIAFKSLLPLREDIVEPLGDKYGTDPSNLVYNGPFVIGQWVKGAKIVLKKNENYWDATNVKLQTVNFFFITESSTEMKMFASKQIDGVAPDAEYYPQLKPKVDSGELNVMKRNKAETRYLAFNNQDKDKLLANTKIRKALSLSIDRDAVIKNLYKSTDSAAYGWIPNGISVANGVEYRQKVTEQPLDKDKTLDPKQLFTEGLKEIGLNPNGKYTIHILQSGQSTTKRALSEYYQNVWQIKLGVTVKVDAVADFAQMSDKCLKGDYQVCIRDWIADYDDVTSFTNVFRSFDPNNTALFKNAKYDEIAKKIELETDPAKKVELVKQADELLIGQESVVAPVYYGTNTKYNYSYIKGMQYPLFISLFELKNAYVQGRN